jgi:hypothetical protein
VLQEPEGHGLADFSEELLKRSVGARLINSSEGMTVKKIFILWLLLPAVPPLIVAQSAVRGATREVHADGADWQLKGEGVVCCPCNVPCPCRTNGSPTYGHCEATLYLHIGRGHHGDVRLDGIDLVNTSGPCAMNYQHLAALYFDTSVTPEQQVAFMKLLASFFQDGTAEFPYVRSVPIHAETTDRHLIYVSIPNILDMAVDRNWGQPDPPFPFFAATDLFSNALQYVHNLRYRMHDKNANLDFDYSERQANYRIVDLGRPQYVSKSMMIQFSDGKGWFNENQLQLVREQHLTLPELDTIGKQVLRLR